MEISERCIPGRLRLVITVGLGRHCPARCGGTGRQAARPSRSRSGAAARSAVALIQERHNSATWRNRKRARQSSQQPVRR